AYLAGNSFTIGDIAAGCAVQRFEKARVFNSDYGLVRKGNDKLDLAFGERANLGASDEDYANCRASVGDGQGGAETSLQRRRPTLGVFIRFGQDVCDLNRAPLEDGASCDEPTHQRERQLSNRN